MSTLSKVRDILLSLSSLPNAPETKDKQELDLLVREYHEVLSQWPDELLDMARLHYKSTETFFPSPGALNNKVLDLQMLSMGVPTAGEAWSQVLTAERHVNAVVCEQGYLLRDHAEKAQIRYDGAGYNSMVDALTSHEADCKICTVGGLKEIYEHPIVEATVKILGGRDKLMTDNAAADRKQFIDAYRERVALEGRKYIMPAQIKEFMSDSRSLQAGEQIKRLAKGLVR